MKYKICGWTMFHCWIYHSLSIAPKENFEKILKKFHKNSKKSKSFFSNPEKVWNSLKHDEYFIHFRLVGLRLDPQKIRKVQFFKKKMLSYFWAFKIDAEKLHFSIFLPTHFRKIAKKNQNFRVRYLSEKQKFWKNYFDIFGFFRNQVWDEPLKKSQKNS